MFNILHEIQAPIKFTIASNRSYITKINNIEISLISNEYLILTKKTESRSKDNIYIKLLEYSRKAEKANIS